MKILILSILFYSYNANATAVCKRNPIYCHIKKLDKRMKDSKAMRLSNIIYKASIKYKIPARIFTAILKAESNLEYKTIRTVCGIKDGKKTCVNTDFGISQIHYKTVSLYNFDIAKLLTNEDYSVLAGAKVLSWFHKTYAKKEKYWWVRFNCGTKRSINRRTCNAYKRAVTRYL